MYVQIYFKLSHILCVKKMLTSYECNNTIVL